MNKKVCETCIKRKTMYCPNSSKCYNTENKPYYQNNVMLLEKYDKSQNKWNELKECLKDNIIECKAVINTILPEFEKIMPRSSGKTLLTNEYNKQQTIIKSFEVMLSKMQELESRE